MTPSTHWNSFLTHLMLWIICYYLLMGILCYHQELLQFFRISPLLAPHHPLILQEQEQYEAHEFQPSELDLLAADDPSTLATYPDPDILRVELLIDQLQSSLMASEGQERTLEHLSMEFRGLLSQFPDLKDSPFEPAINEFLYKEALHHGFDFLNQSKVQQLWSTP